MIASTQSNSPFGAPEQDDALDRERLISKLRTFGLRVTSPRIALLSALASAGQPLTIDQLFTRTGDQTCDLVTIYRTMAAFEKAGVVYRSGFSARGAALFSVVSEGVRKYPLIRKGSAVAEELDDESSRELRVTIERIRNRLRARGYGELEHIVEFFAVSPSRAGDAGL
jgi:Fur family ferric uptake transcriptional regulator